jgi:hypothetical protein
MANFKSWDPISGPGSGQVVLVLDIPPARPGHLTELAAKIRPEYTFLRAKLPSAGWAGHHADFWLDDIRQSYREVVAVLGCRVGSVYAAVLADQISKTQMEPPLILFDPQFASVALLVHEFRREIRAISSLLSDNEIERARKIAAEITRMQTADLASVGDEIREHYNELSAIAFERVGLGDVRGNNSITSFESCISCICQAAGLDPRDAWKNSTAIVSSECLGVPGAQSLTASMVGQQIPFDMTHADLLRSDSVAQLVIRLLEYRQGCH